MNFQMFKLVLEKAEEPEIKLSTSAGSSQKKEFQKNIYFCFIDYAKDFDCVNHNKLWKILQARLQQYVNCDLPDVQPGFRKGRGTRDQIANIHWIMEKAREFQKNMYFCFIDYAKAFDCVDHNKLWKIQEMGIPAHLTCLLRNLYAV